MEYPIAELFVNARVQRIYGGTNEIMKELASRSIPLSHRCEGTTPHAQANPINTSLPDLLAQRWTKICRVIRCPAAAELRSKDPRRARTLPAAQADGPQRLRRLRERTRLRAAGQEPGVRRPRTHALQLDVCEQVLGPNFMLSACLAINTYPGENAQPLHFDDSFYKVPRPRPAYGVSCFWAIDEFTADNGATEIIPGSHKWGSDAPIGASFYDAFINGKKVPVEDHPDLEPVIMPAGSLMLTPGTLWHRGGENKSNSSRLVITPQYCVAWGRQMESMLLSVPPHIVATYPEQGSSCSATASIRRSWVTPTACTQ
jgi:hypothetical protein